LKKLITLTLRVAIVHLLTNNKLIPTALPTTFLGLTVDSTLSWRMHIGHLTTKLSNACYVIKPLMSQDLTIDLSFPFSYSQELWDNILG
jgi:hypothetical protein